MSTQVYINDQNDQVINSKPRVLIVLNRYRPMIGGAERQCELLSAQLEGEVQWVGILTHRYASELKASEIIGNIRVYRLGRLLHSTTILTFYLELFYYLNIKKREYDLVHCHTAGLTGLWVASICRFLKKPVLLKLTAEGELNQQIASGVDHERSVFSFLKHSIRRVLCNISTTSPHTNVVALTYGGRDEVLASGISQVHVIPNGVDLAKYQATTHYRSENSDLVRFGYIGRLTAEKGTHLLVDAFDSLFGMHANLQLSIAGSGERQLQSSEDKIQELIKRWPHLVEHLGSVSDSVFFLSGLDVYISASSYEGLPNAVLEALAVGLPCVLSNIEAHREVSRLNPNATIFFFEPNDFDSLVAAVSRVLKDWPVQRSFLSCDLDIKNVANKYLDLYKKIIWSDYEKKCQ